MHAIFFTWVLFCAWTFLHGTFFECELPYMGRFLSVNFLYMRTFFVRAFSCMGTSVLHRNSIMRKNFFFHEYLIFSTETFISVRRSLLGLCSALELVYSSSGERAKWSSMRSRWIRHKLGLHRRNSINKEFRGGTMNRWVTVRSQSAWESNRPDTVRTIYNSKKKTRAKTRITETSSSTSERVPASGDEVSECKMKINNSAVEFKGQQDTAANTLGAAKCKSGASHELKTESSQRQRDIIRSLEESPR